VGFWALLPGIDAFDSNNLVRRVSNDAKVYGSSYLCRPRMSDIDSAVFDCVAIYNRHHPIPRAIAIHIYNFINDAVITIRSKTSTHKSSPNDNKYANSLCVDSDGTW